MAIARVAIPTPTSPTVLGDYQAILDQLAGLNQSLTGRAIADGSLIRAGTIMLIGGVLYKATSDTTITGTPSAYVKITPSGASATAAFVASLTGVTFNEAYGGYYDGSGNLHAFDEGQAVADGVITAPRTLIGLAAGPRMRTFTASGTFVVPPGVTKVWVTGCAVGGAGGAGGNSSGTNVGGGGGGGGRGMAVTKKSIAVTPGASITVTIGGAAANTTFGGLLTLSPGVPGTAGATSGTTPGIGGPGAGDGSQDAILGGGKQGGDGDGAPNGGGGGAASPLDMSTAGTTGSPGASGGGGGAGGSYGGGGGGGGGGFSAPGPFAGGAGAAGNAYGSGGGGGGGTSGNTGSRTGGTGGIGGPGILTVEW